MTTTQLKLITVDELKKKIDNDPHLCLIDVREPHEWKELHIPGAHLIPKDKLIDEIQSVVSHKNQPIYLHCRGGVRSCDAGLKLITMGYKEIYSLEGGIMEWAAMGYPVKAAKDA